MTIDEDAILPSASVAVAAGAVSFWVWGVTGGGRIDVLPTLLVVLSTLYAARQVQDYLQILRAREHQRRRRRGG